jgi:hypothetical protein
MFRSPEKGTVQIQLGLFIREYQTDRTAPGAMPIYSVYLKEVEDQK